ncbi:MAG: cation transporter, partial [Anaerolineaceae bacterium]
VAASLSGSAAMFADAANSVSDVAYSLMMVLGLWVAQRPPDLSHPQGHSRFEPFVGLMVTLSMAFAGYEAARNSIERFIAGGAAIEVGLPALVLLLAAAIKAGMFIAIRNIARKVNSPTLSTTAT